MAAPVDSSRDPSPSGARRLTLVEGTGGGGEGTVRRRGGRGFTQRAWAVLVCLMERPTDPANRYAIAKSLQGYEGAPGFTESSVYREIDRLVESGHVDEVEIVTSRGALRGYVLTTRGWEAVRGWVRTPAAIPIEVCPEAWLRVASVSFSAPKDVVQGLSALADELDKRALELERNAQLARRGGTWNIAAQLDLALHRASLDASQRWVGEALALLATSQG